MKGRLKKRAEELGFGILGVAEVSQFEKHPPVPKSWTEDGRFQRPGEVWSEARSVVVVGMPVIDEVMDALVWVGDTRILFYYEAIHHRLGVLCDWLRDEGVVARAVAGDISCKRAAILAGLGHAGKNSLVITPEYGSNVRLGVLLTDAAMPFDQPNDPFAAELCTGCDRCRSVCPEDAVGEYQMDFDKCLVPATGKGGARGLRAERLQRRGGFSVECNLCQKVCPLNDLGQR